MNGTKIASKEKAQLANFMGKVFFSKLNRTDHTKLAKCCEVVHCDRLADESYYSREVRDVREVLG